MRSRVAIGSLVLLIVIAIGFAATRTAAAPAIKWAAVNFTETTMIAGKFVSGPVVFVHDDARMARGEPCTSVHRYDPAKGLQEELVSFHCKPRWTKAVDRFTNNTTRKPDGPPVLVEYQFAGDEEAHGVPTRPVK